MESINDYTVIQEVKLRSGNIAKIVAHPKGGVNILFERSSMTNGDTKWFDNKEGEK